MCLETPHAGVGSPPASENGWPRSVAAANNAGGASGAVRRSSPRGSPWGERRAVTACSAAPESRRHKNDGSEPSRQNMANARGGISLRLATRQKHHRGPQLWVGIILNLNILPPSAGMWPGQAHWNGNGNRRKIEPPNTAVSPHCPSPAFPQAQSPQLGPAAHPSLQHIDCPSEQRDTPPGGR